MLQRAWLRRMDASLERIDGHMERGNALMESIDEEIRLTREEVRLTREEVELSRQSRDDLRTFIREMVIRMERAAQHQAAELREVRKETRDLREESRAHTQALLAMIDRLGPSGSSA